MYKYLAMNLSSTTEQHQKVVELDSISLKHIRTKFGNTSQNLDQSIEHQWVEVKGKNKKSWAVFTSPVQTRAKS